ncbi:phospholipase D-like domain-containing protein [Amycolatopsis sp. NPDC003731]
MTTVEVYVECEVLEARLQLSPVSAASSLETLVLKAILAGVDTAHELAMLFGVTSRLMVDLLGDLWRDQRITFEFGMHTERITVSPEARKELNDLGVGEKLNSSLRSSVPQTILLDTLTGRVLPERFGRYTPRQARLVVTRTPDDRSAGDIDTAELTAAISRDVEWSAGGPQVEGMRVVKAYLTPDAPEAARRHRYLAMSVKVAVDQADRIVLEVDDPRLPAEAQRIANQRLQALLENDPQSPFAGALRAEAGQVLDPPSSLYQQLTGFRQSVRALGGVPPASRQSEHDRLALDGGRLAARVQDMARREMSVSVIRTPAEHRTEILDLIGAAERQIVLVAPWVTYRGVQPYLEALTEAARRGVRIILLWGINRRDDSLPTPVVNALDDISRAAQATGRGGGVHFDREQPSHVHAKVVLVDDRRVLVTSFNFMSGNLLSEVGFSARADQDTTCPLAEELLRWAYNAQPSYRLACLLLKSRDLFGERSAERVSVVPECPEFSPRIAAAEPQSAPAVLWSREWQDFGERLAAATRMLRPVTYPVVDHLHSSLMWDALRGASNRVLIASDKFSSTVVTSGFVAEVKRCLQRGVHVALVYRTLHDESEDEQTVTALRAVARQAADEATWGTLTLKQDETNHAKVLIFDDETVVGSYNYLSYEAQYGRGRRSGRSEVSIQLVSPSTTDSVAQSVLGSATSWPIEAEEAAAPAVNAVSRAAQLALHELDRTELSDQSRLVAYCRSGDSEFTVADALVETNVPDADLERVHAAMFAAADPGEAAVEWGRRLLDALWRREEWITAHLVRAGIPDAALRPRTAITAVAAGMGSDLVTDLLVDAVLTDDLEQDELDVLAAIGAAALLETGDARLGEPLTILGESATAAVQEFVVGAQAFGWEFGRLPREDLHAAAAADRRRTVAGDNWALVADAIDKFERYQPNCPQGDLTKKYLLGDGGALDTLRRTARRRDHSGLARWVERNDEPSEQKWLDKATRASGSPTLVPDGKHRSMVIKSRAIFDPVRALLADGPDHAGERVPDRVLQRLDEIRDRATNALAKLSPSPQSRPAARVLENLIDLLRGGRDD